MEKRFLESRAGEDGDGKTLVSRCGFTAKLHKRVLEHSQHGGRLMKLCFTNAKSANRVDLSGLISHTHTKTTAGGEERVN